MEAIRFPGEQNQPDQLFVECFEQQFLEEGKEECETVQEVGEARLHSLA